jgi:selenocysteine lyase/cysteine desulfurase
VEVRFCPTPGGHIDIGALLSRVTSTTRAIALSHVQWTNGFKVDLEPLGRFCREQGILSIVDAIQSLGVQPIDVRSAPIDVLVSGCFKWLLGIPGMALLYVSREALARFHPDRAGTESVVSHDSLDLAWRGDSLRFLVGSLNEPALCVLAPSVELLQELGIPQIQAHTAALVDRIDTGLQNLGLSITSSPLPEHRSSILSFTTGSRAQDDRLVRRLLDRNVITGLRPSGVRVAPHFYNTVSDVDALLDAVKCSIR